MPKTLTIPTEPVVVDERAVIYDVGGRDNFTRQRIQAILSHGVDLLAISPSGFEYDAQLRKAKTIATRLRRFGVHVAIIEGYGHQAIILRRLNPISVNGVTYDAPKP